MISFSNTLSIKREVDLVFRFFSNPQNLPLWNGNIQSVTPVEGHILSKGSRFIMHTLKEKNEILIIDFLENTHVTFETIASVSPYFKREMKFTKVGEATILEDNISLNTKYPSFLERLFQRKTSSSVLNNLRLAKYLLEQEDNTQEVDLLLPG